MDRARKRLRMWLIGMVLVAVVVGIFYYYYGVKGSENLSEGTLVRRSEEFRGAMLDTGSQSEQMGGINGI
ncbi:MAG: hypothetical protein PHN80_03480 [Hespellia sp.]|nr:hypothetical protein [Hespellia sp.]